MAAKESALSAYLKRVLFAGGVALCVIAVALLIWARAEVQTRRVVYRVGPPGSDVPADQLERTVDVLSARLAALRRELNLGRCSVRPLPPDRLELEIRCRTEPEHALAWLTLQGRAEFRLLHPADDVLETAGPEGLPPEYEVKLYRERRYVLIKLDQLKTVERSYALQREPVLTVQGFQEVKFQTVGTRRTVVLTFYFSDPDAEAFGPLTALHAGRKMAMLVDGEMFFPPKEIESAMTTGAVQVQGVFYIRPLRRLAKVLNCGSLPARLEEVSRSGGRAK